MKFREKNKLSKSTESSKFDQQIDKGFYCRCVSAGLALLMLLQSNNYLGADQSFVAGYVRHLKAIDKANSVKLSGNKVTVEPEDDKNDSNNINKHHTSWNNQSCSAEQRETIRYQLPPEHCEAHKTQPWTNRCSFSYATRCPQSTWLEHLYQQPASTSQQQRPTAIYVGCNKGMDAINTLRMISSDPKFDKKLWKQTFSRNQSGVIVPGHCGQEYDEQFDLASLSRPAEPGAVVYCIEAMPITARRLSESAHDLHWDQNLKVSNMAMSSVDGTALFPDQSEKIGVEQQGLANCKQDRPVSEQPHCKEVPMHRLDTFVKENVDGNDSSTHHRIDFLSIDVEGFDREVLIGANETLKRIGYLEFEYNWRGLWPKAKLSDTVRYLHDHGFVCYWAGAYGNIWRISGDCFLDHYDIHHWSNVACVNARDPQSVPIHQKMEMMFQQTLARGKGIQYAEEVTANTDGQEMEFN